MSELETIIGLGVAVAGATAYIVKLHMKVSKLEKHPLLMAFEALQKKQAIDALDKLLTNSKVEKQ